MDFVIYFHAFIEIVMWLLSIVLLIWYINFLMLNQLCIPGVNLNSWYIALLNVAHILLRIFVSVFMRDIGL